MTIYDKVWSLVCRHPARSSFNEGLSQQSQSGIFFDPYHHDMVSFGLHCHRDSSSWYQVVIFVSLNPESSAVAPMKLQATPQAMPQAIFQNFRIFRNFSPRRRPRLRLRA
ncbi:hypothetical protein T10_4877 [Trichinella papuae]|uniref:Uncharacterized protein n=1 Tax=Trichinella papuae TaxID=268474 RepID=A0A0V1MXV9_9BILA|nr:hypothetical protein T10_4877 [Trichinella papuae]